MTVNNKFIEQIELKNYKSIKDTTITLSSLNILIGVNGSGKSNFISFFNFLNYFVRDIVKTSSFLKDYVAKSGGAEKFITFDESSWEFGIHFNNPVIYKFKGKFDITLDKTLDNKFDITLDKNLNKKLDSVYGMITGITHRLSDEGNKKLLSDAQNLLQKIGAGFHFDKARDNSPMSKIIDNNDDWFLRPDGENIAGMLMRINKMYPKYYDLIVQTIRMVVPDFHDFLIHYDTEYVQLEWLNKYYPDKPLRAHYLSDGSLRFICLATLLLMPTELQPEVIIIDEPELGLHPYAISILADLIWQASQNRQLIVATQSPLLLERFSADDIIVVDKENQYSKFRRLNPKDLDQWLDKYNMDELWQRGILGGQP